MAWTLALGLLGPQLAVAQTVFTNPYTDLQLLGTQNQIGNASSAARLTVANNAEVTIASGGTFTAETGSVVDLFNATVALPDALTLKDIKFEGSNNQLKNAATFTLLSGSSFTAAAGSTLDLSAANATFPTTVVLTTGEQTLVGKTLTSPIINTLSAANGTNLSLNAGSSGAAITLGQGADGGLSLMPKGNGTINFSSTATYHTQDTTGGGVPVAGRGFHVLDPVQSYFMAGTNQATGYAVNLFYQSTAPVDQKMWQIGMWNNDGAFRLGLANDAGDPRNPPIEVTLSAAGNVSLTSTTSGTSTTSASITAKSIGLTENAHLGGILKVNGSASFGGVTASALRLGQILETAATSNYGGAAFTTWSESDHFSILDFNRSGNSNQGSYAAVANNLGLGLIAFRGTDGTAFQPAAAIKAEVAGTVSAGIVPGRLDLATSNTSGALVAGLRIDQAQKVSILANTASSSPTTGAMTVAGGLGVAGALHAGSAFHLDNLGNSLAYSVLNNSGYLQATAEVVNAGGAAQLNTKYGSAFGVFSTYSDTNTTFGQNRQSWTTLVHAGGNGLMVGTAEADPVIIGTNNTARFTVAAGGDVSITNPTASSSPTTGALTVAGGLGVTGSAFIGGNIVPSGRVVLAGGGTAATGLWLDGTQSWYAANSGQLTYDQGGTGNAFISIRGGSANTLGIKAGSSSGGTQGGYLAWSDVSSSENMQFGVGGSEVARASGTNLAAGNFSVKYTTPSTSSSTGALQVSGGAGIAGALNVGGTGSIGGALGVASTATFGGKLRITNDYAGLNELGFYSSSGSTHYGTIGIASANASLSAEAAAQDLVVRSQAALRLTAGGATDRLVIGATDGAVSIASTTAASSTSTGALVVGGGAAIQKKVFVGDDLMVVPTDSTAATVRLSGTAVADTPGIWFRDGGAPTGANAAISGSATSTILNGPAGGTVSVRLGGAPYLTLTSTQAVLQTVPLKVLATTASTSTTSGSGTFGGGIGVSGRTSTGSLSVGGGATVTAVLSTTASVDFPAVAGGGGVQDVALTLTGAALGNDVSVVEAGGVFAEAGLVIRAIVTAANTVTLRATNTTGSAINPAATTYRVTVTKF